MSARDDYEQLLAERDYLARTLMAEREARALELAKWGTDLAELHGLQRTLAILEPHARVGLDRLDAINALAEELARCLEPPSWLPTSKTTAHFEQRITDELARGGTVAEHVAGALALASRRQGMAQQQKET